MCTFNTYDIFVCMFIYHVCMYICMYVCMNVFTISLYSIYEITGCLYGHIGRCVLVLLQVVG